MKNINRYLQLLFLIIISFYVIGNMKIETDEMKGLRKQLDSRKKYYEIEPIDATIEEKIMIPGRTGIQIDYEKSIFAMKEYGAYNETLIKTKTVSPKKSIAKYYKKYIEQGNGKERNVSLVFKINKEEEIDSILKILNDNNQIANFFLEESIVKKRENLIKQNKNHHFSLLISSNSNQETMIKSSLSFLNSLTKNNTNYCYTENDNQELLELCSKLSIHTIKPTIVIKSHLLQTIKEEINNSLILSIDSNLYNRKELKLALEYIKSKGYLLVSLEELLKE